MSKAQPQTLQIPQSLKCLFERSRYKGLWGGRGGAKSHSIAAALLVHGVERPERILCCREIQRSIRDSVKRLLDDKIAVAKLSGFYQSTDSEIRGANGTLFIFAGLRTNTDSVKSLEGVDIAWVEEANTVSRSSLDILIPTIRKDGSELWFSWNPRYATDPVDAMFRGKDGPPPGAIVKEITWKDNPWFPDVLRKEMEWDLKRDPDKYAHIWGGQYLRNSEARVFKNWRVGSQDEFNPKPETRFYYGADWGFSIDPSVLVRCWLDARTLYVDHEAYAVGCEIDRTPDLFRKVPDSEQWPIRADSARPETISYMRRNGFPRMVAAQKGANSVADGIEFLKSYDIVVHPRATHLIDELTMYSWKVDPLTGQILPILEDKKNHVIDSLRYALEDARRPTWGLA